MNKLLKKKKANELSFEDIKKVFCSRDKGKSPIQIVENLSRELDGISFSTKAFEN